ncbi:MAG: pseudouridine synthase [Bacteroidota bacterium]
MKYIVFYKSYGVLSQFTSEQGKRSLKDFGFPNGVYPVGRLDYDSEGLLLLTDDNDVKHKLTDPKFELPKTYLAQVERLPSEDALQRLRTGVVIEGKKTKPAEVRLLDKEPDLPPRSVPIRFRKTVPTAWIELTIREGRNRQVRKMTAAVGHPTLRLMRIKIGNIEIDGLKPGEWKEIIKEELYLP